MNLKALAEVLFLCALPAFGISGAGASEPKLCGPRDATLTFADDDHELAVKVQFHEGKSDCTFDYERLENVRPVNISIHFNNREFKVGKKCLEEMKFDLHGITVEFSDGRFTVWFQESPKAVPDQIQRDLSAVSIRLAGGLTRCEYPGGATW